MTSLGNQLRQVFRRLRRAPMFTAITLATLAIAIGANAAIFSVVEGVLLKPLPYPHPEELVGLWHTAPGVGLNHLNMSPSMYFIYREQNRSFEDIGLYRTNTFTVTGIAEPAQVRALQVTDGTLPLLGVTPALGRLFNRADDSPSGAKTVILSYGYWQRQFGGDRNVLGRNLTIDNDAYQIIGVLPESFRFLDEETPPLVLPFQLNREKTLLGQFGMQGLARLRTGVSIQQANADVARMIPIVWDSFPAPPGFSTDLFKSAHVAPLLRPLKQEVVGDVGTLLWVLMGGIGMVLLIACANIANLLLVRVEGRQQELAIRSALGASWGKIARELLLESVLLGLIGSAIGLGLAYAALRALVAIAPTGLPRLDEIGIDIPVLLFTLGVAIFASLLFGCVPVFKYAGARLATGLREIGRTLTQSRERHRVRSVLVVVQVALAFVLMISSGLMIRTFRAMTHVNAGFADPGTLQTLRVVFPYDDGKNQEDALVHSQQEILNRIAAIPGVRTAAFAHGVPLDGNDWTDPVWVQGKTYATGQLPDLCQFHFISPGYLETLGTPLVAGREFTWTDTFNRAPVAMVSEKVARKFWGSPAAALGKEVRVSTTDDWRQVIGVVADVHNDGMSLPAPLTMYWPVLMNRFESNSTQVQPNVAYAVRTPRADSASLMKDIQRAVWSVNSNMPISNVHTLDYYYTQSMARTSFTLVMLAIAGGMALLLGVVGLYGVIAYSVSQRTREIGIRIALGAQQPALVAMFVRNGLWLAAAGVVCGAIGAFASMRLLSSLLFGVSTADPVTYAAVVVALIATAAFACYLPSRRAAGVDPVEALRAE